MIDLKDATGEERNYYLFAGSGPGPNLIWHITNPSLCDDILLLLGRANTEKRSSSLSGRGKIGFTPQKCDELKLLPFLSKQDQRTSSVSSVDGISNNGQSLKFMQGATFVIYSLKF